MVQYNNNNNNNNNNHREVPFEWLERLRYGAI